MTAVVAVVIVVAGLVYAYFRRADGTDSAASVTGDGALCGTTVCQVVIGRSVGRDLVELLVGTGGGRIRISGESGPFAFEMIIAESGAAVTGKSLQCVDAEVSVCLVHGARGTELLGEVLVRKDDTWSRAQAYLATGGFLGLHDVDGDGIADVVAAQLACDGHCANAFVQVFSVLGPDLGCTATAPVPDQLAGWPAPVPQLSQLRPCAD